MVTKRAAYFTDSQVAQVYRVRIRRDGSLGKLKRIPLTGDLQYVDGFNAQRHRVDRQAADVVQSNTGKLFCGEPALGPHARDRDSTRRSPMGDGLLLRGRKLFVVRTASTRSRS